MSTRFELEPIDATAVVASAHAAQLDSDTIAAVASLAASVAANASTEAVTRRLRAALLGCGPNARDAAIAEIASLGLEATMGSEATLYYLLLALLELPAAQARHQRLGVSEAVSRETWRDLALWCAWAREHDFFGLSLEELAWAQHYLRGDLLRIGPIELELCAFHGPVVGFRSRESGALRVLAIPGTRFARDGRAVGDGPDAFVAGGSLDGPRLVGHPVDPSTGAVLREPTTLDGTEWERWVWPGVAMLEQHTPSDARVCLDDFLRAGREAFTTFEALFPEAAPRGVFGEAWLLDPQLDAVLPRPRRVAEFRQASHLYPSRLPEAKTIRRVFGPRATRASVVAAPRDPTNVLQRRLADFLAAPEHHLCAAGGLILRERIDARAAALEQG